ncbi:MAG TPA: hypothetical protein VIM73_00385, partial [Polyangiaceae bacterium]
LCRRFGWVARSVNDPELAIVHLRQMGSSHKSLWVGRQRWGRGKYFMGSSPLYMTAVTLYRMAERPYVVGGLGILVGYVRAGLERAPRMKDPVYLSYLRRFERSSLVIGKRWTTRLYDARIRKDAPPHATRTA